FTDLFDQEAHRIPRFDGRRIRLVTARSMAPFIRDRAPRLREVTGAEVEVLEVTNEYFGPSVTIAGLLGGRDILGALGGSTPRDLVVLPAEALNQDERFIDDLPM